MRLSLLWAGAFCSTWIPATHLARGMYAAGQGEWLRAGCKSIPGGGKGNTESPSRGGRVCSSQAPEGMSMADQSRSTREEASVPLRKQKVSPSQKTGKS